jgi:SNF2 family DNA or RNA helicase
MTNGHYPDGDPLMVCSKYREGITLTASSHVVFAELDWHPGMVTQAEDRLHRLVQCDSVTVQHIVLDGSLDARVAPTILEKQRLIDTTLDDEIAPVVIPRYL